MIKYTYKCTKDFFMNDGEQVFTKDKIYEGHDSATPSEDWAILFINDLSDYHLMNGEYLHDNFELLSKEEIDDQI